MVLFYTSSCKPCQKFYPTYEKISKMLKKKNTNLILSTIDMEYNEIESINLTSFPTIKLYPGNKKNMPPIEYNGDKSIEDIINFIKNNAANPIILEENNNIENKDKTYEL